MKLKLFVRLVSQRIYSKTTLISGGRRYCQSANGPLHGIRVLDMTRVLAGPFATMMFGDMGAEIIKVERPGVGDDTRSWGPPFVKDESVYFLSVNRNKQSICVDMKKPEGIKILKELATKCDVLIENFLPGKLKSFGLDHESLKSTCPQLIHCSINGFGDSGPYANRAGYDSIAAAVGGLISITGPEDGEPCRVGVAVTDISTGLFAHGAILTALIERQRTGKGSYISCSLLASQVAVLSHLAANYLNCGLVAKPRGTGHTSLVPYQAFPTKDGNLVIGAGNDMAFKKLCEVLDIPDIAEAKKFLTNKDRVENRNELVELLCKRFVCEETKYWENKLRKASIAYGPINSIKEVFDDPQFAWFTVWEHKLQNNSVVLRKQAT